MIALDVRKGVAICCVIATLSNAAISLPRNSNTDICLIARPGVDSTRTENLLAAEIPCETTTINDANEYIWVASYYGQKFHGRYTASGEIFDQQEMTCAHKTLAFGTRLLVTNTKNNQSVEVRINDRGPFIKGRQLDLSHGAAEKIGMLKAGVAKVKVIILK